MGKMAYRGLGLWGGVCCLLPLGAGWATPREVKLVADEWCPYNCSASESESPGFLVEMAKKALEPLGYKVSYETMPWARAVKEVTAGTYDILVATDPVENPQLKFVKKPDLPCSFKLFSMPDKTFSYTGPQSLSDKRLGAIDDYLYNEELNAYMKDNRKNQQHIQILAGDKALDRNIKKLIHDRIDVLVENPYVLKYRLKELGVSQTLVETGNLDQSDRFCYLGLSPALSDGAELAEILSQRVEVLESNGTLAALRSKYAISY